MHKWILAGFCAALMILIVNALLGYHSLRTVVENNRWVTHSHEVQRGIEALLSGVKDLESGQRDFLLTGDQASLETSKAGKEQLAGRFVQVRELTRDNASQRRRLEELHPLLVARVKTLADAIRVRRRQGLEAAKDEMLAAGEKREMEQIEQLIAAMLQEEVRLLDRRTRQSRASARRLLLMFALAAVLDVGSVAGVFWLYRRDVAERQRTNAALLRAQGDLEQRVMDRTAELEAANKELEAFSYTVSHDLRAPLRAIDGFSRILLDEFAPSLPDECQQHLRDVRANTQQMGRLVDDLLTFSRLSRQPLKEEKLAPGEVARHVFDDLSAGVKDRKVELRISELPACRCDPALLKQVWTNLISNALKYTGKRPAAVIEIGSLAAANGKCTYFVRDNGVGFDMRYAHKLFGVFQRLHRAEEYEGTGVGLAIVQRIIHRHGGSIWVDAKPNVGATFFFTLPTSEAVYAE